MKEIAAKLLARRLASLLLPASPRMPRASRVLPAKLPARDVRETSERLDIPAAEPAASTACQLCDTEWGAMTVDEIAELLVQSGRFPEEQRAALMSLPRERLVSVFCGCSASLRLPPPSPGASAAPRPARR